MHGLHASLACVSPYAGCSTGATAAVCDALQEQAVRRASSFNPQHVAQVAACLPALSASAADQPSGSAGAVLGPAAAVGAEMSQIEDGAGGQDGDGSIGGASRAAKLRLAKLQRGSLWAQGSLSTVGCLVAVMRGDAKV